MKGIDVSENNGYIDFEKVKNNGVDFVIIRIGWIGNKENHTMDKYFESYYQKAKEAGLKIGFYVYSYCKSIDTIKSGSEWVLNQLILRNIKNFEMPLFIDMEDNTTISCRQRKFDIAGLRILQNYRSKRNKSRSICKFKLV